MPQDKALDAPKYNISDKNFINSFYDVLYNLLEKENSLSKYEAKLFSSLRNIFKDMKINKNQVSLPIKLSLALRNFHASESKYHDSFVKELKKIEKELLSDAKTIKTKLEHLKSVVSSYDLEGQIESFQKFYQSQKDSDAKSEGSFNYEILNKKICILLKHITNYSFLSL